MSGPLAGEIALVTGASGGLGRRFAVALAEQGATVVATARRKDRLDEVAAEIANGGGRCVPWALDLENDDLGEALARISDEVGLITILVNNAAAVDGRRAHKMPVELTDTVLDTNLRAPWLLATGVAARLIEAGRGGRIVNISSIAATNYGPDSAPAALYSVTKAALNRMTEVLGVEWARFGINVNGIEPGFVHTEMVGGMMERTGLTVDQVAARQPRKRMMTPADLDGTLLYLVGPASATVTGTVVVVDDGGFGR
ncbi:SDR family NAD(P)-dependent oxidoreductase [Sporichthya polymorpha]|uniref:SDR family NAD(P)-dependent oxidoreductase n=1 Tax=Sporichthya polymorpha TaxID=35751 RepID=UPI00037FAF22|nr:SDR family oxidoreductase [Sporichthya polymorpha]